MLLLFTTLFIVSANTHFLPDIDSSSPASNLNSIFQGVICPAPVIRKGGSEIGLEINIYIFTHIHIFKLSSHVLGLPEQYSVNLSDNCLNFPRILTLLQYDVFIRTPISFQKSLLDMLYLILRKDIYTVSVCI